MVTLLQTTSTAKSLILQVLSSVEISKMILDSLIS